MHTYYTHTHMHIHLFIKSIYTELCTLAYATIHMCVCKCMCSIHILAVAKWVGQGRLGNGQNVFKSKRVFQMHRDQADPKHFKSSTSLNFINDWCDIYYKNYIITKLFFIKGI